MKAWEKYFDTALEIIQEAKKTQAKNIEAAADILTEVTKNDGLIHVFGAGHSHILGAEVHWRSATLANIHGIVESGVAGSPHEVTKSQYVEKMEGYGELIVDYHKIDKKDAAIVVSNSGNNAVTIDFAKRCQELGVKVIAITAVEYSDYLKPLHTSGRKMKDYADVVLDNCSPIGDALVDIEDFPIKVGGASTPPSVILLHSVLSQTVENLVKLGVTPDVYYNGSLAANSEDVKHHNEKIVNKYFFKIRNL